MGWAPAALGRPRLVAQVDRNDLAWGERQRAFSSSILLFHRELITHIGFTVSFIFDLVGAAKSEVVKYTLASYSKWYTITFRRARTIQVTFTQLDKGVTGYD